MIYCIILCIIIPYLGTGDLLTAHTKIFKIILSKEIGINIIPNLIIR